jgi:signal transduction histidine kinase
VPIVSIIAIATGSLLEIYFGMQPLLIGLGAAIALFLTAAFASKMWRLLSLATNIALGLTLSAYATFYQKYDQRLYGLQFDDYQAKLVAFCLLAAFILSANILFWLLGRLAITKEVYVGTEFDRALSAQTQAKLSLEVAEQNERFLIARDINELIIQKITAVISQAEGGSYAVKADPTSASRILERVVASARGAHTELRRLFDMLNKTHDVSAAPPGVAELESLVVAYRELGFNVWLSHEGKRFAISEGAGLAIHRIVLDALENVQKHCPIGTDASIAFTWVDEGMQVLIKDNGIETSRRSTVNLGDNDGYTVEDDLRALVEPIKGAGLTAMRERAALYGGSIEATRVPGVGFTVSAIFPNLKALASVD